MDEWHHVLGRGPGAVVITDLVPTSAVDEAGGAFARIAQSERAARSGGGGDHFASSGANVRIWNSFEKLAMDSPSTFVRYHSSTLLDLVCEAWLGPRYQMTAQLNNVMPGGAGQKPHRDYHLGFQSQSQAQRFPAAAHIASQHLTLQGAVAQSDMPLETGPTLLLPGSQLLKSGYIDFHEAQARDSFVQLELRKGDGLFFNPALIHAAGTNRTADVVRSANLLQISSAFGRPMEHVDRTGITLAVFTRLRALYAGQQPTHPSGLRALVRAVARGYAFPTNLDLDRPSPDGGMPTTEQDLLWQALGEGWHASRFAGEMQRLTAKRPASM
ncbi:related to protein involved in biosynthesis of mitomycin antibiotics/polyketide fumonisin [Pseudozyma flocculosa]|uniref:Related to protein involved in biosynthesis of mitomycin antibiotics/polyketide fumonisin n=1 Tax=Pseudozyma flocculosa TaxID=84751 RepID=A0A5C3FAH3_9BASI|nr:related to protein involved in biosynthesis of mitomycin antibiotics/polyketide fumonisin [Pseudozyma flocculosa]